MLRRRHGAAGKAGGFQLSTTRVRGGGEGAAESGVGGDGGAQDRRGRGRLLRRTEHEARAGVSIRIE